MGLFGSISKPGPGALKALYRPAIMREMRAHPENHKDLVLDLALESVSREKSEKIILWIAGKMELKEVSP